MNILLRIATLTSFGMMFSGMFSYAGAAVSLDRTRVIFNGAEKSVSLKLTNENKTLPYLAQGWVEDTQGNKITDPLMLLPPVQRIEPGEQTQLKVQSTPSIRLLPQDRESLFYFNLREIPPRSTRPNTLQLALQTRIKLFYRPEAIAVQRADYSTPFQNKLTMTRQGDKYRVNNPTPYYISLVNASSTLDGKPAGGFKAIMIEPKSDLVLAPSSSALGNNPVLTYVNDFGGRANLVFNCSSANCITIPQKKNP